MDNENYFRLKIYDFENYSYYPKRPIFVNPLGILFGIVPPSKASSSTMVLLEEGEVEGAQNAIVLLAEGIAA